MQRRLPLALAATAYAVAVLWATLGPAPWSTVGYELPNGILNPLAWTMSATWSTGYLSEIAFNVVMFIPVGVLASALLPRRRAWLPLLIGVAFTTCIELVQIPLTDRISDPRDLVANTVGAIVGVAAVALTRLVRKSRPLLVRAEGIADGHPAPTASASADAAADAAHAPTGRELASAGSDRSPRRAA
ncbi:VanZ family protein [Agromyces seonyuensis]|uniref:VanZ family protein n=1 Tax=Agromyces seonyuensis TaxID=2662446 RepID=A0A6I4P160_9MICO|nr:VanZ family protein [Agromyces seonyuensis]MWC00287.1 VanZ family protein [Agromyces seonyuensis]